MRRFLFLFFLGALGALAVRTVGFEGIYLASDSMAPTLPKGRHIIVNKFVLLFRAPRRGEVVMFDSPLDRSKGLVKRVIAIGGDTFAIKKKKVILNGAPLDEPYVQYLRADTLLEGDDLEPMTIPKDYLFVMGDNRDVSGDSRDWKTPEGKWTPFLSVSSVHGLVQGAEETGR